MRLMGVMRNGGDDIFLEHVRRGSPLSLAASQNTKGGGILEDKSVRGFHNYHCFLGAQGSGKVQHCQDQVFFRLFQYEESYNGDVHLFEKKQF